MTFSLSISFFSVKNRRLSGFELTIDGSLAYANIYHVLSALFRRFNLELVDTVRERDVDMARDHLVGKPAKESKGIRVRIVGEADI